MPSTLQAWGCSTLHASSDEDSEALQGVTLSLLAPRLRHVANMASVSKSRRSDGNSQRTAAGPIYMFRRLPMNSCTRTACDPEA